MLNQQMLLIMSKMLQNNPMFQRAQQMAQGKTEQELQQTAQNLCNQMGIDMEEARKQFENEMPKILNNITGGINR